MTGTAAREGSGGRNVGQGERLASVVGGVALAVFGLSRRSPAGVALAALGGSLLYRGATGHCLLYEAAGVSTADAGAADGIRVEKSVTVNCPREEVYRFWRRLENLPHFMKHLEAVTDLGAGRSHWVARAPAGQTVEWDAEITEDVPGARLGWRSLPDSQIPNEGSVRFVDGPGGQGTEIHIMLQYQPPAGLIGAALAKLWREEPSMQLKDDLRRFKQIMEAGEVATTQGQPSGREEAAE